MSEAEDQQLTAKPPTSTAIITANYGLAIPTKKRKEVVLEEDTYVEALEAIIQRDFFPDLPKLNAQLEYMEAEENNDVVKMRELQQRFSTQRRPATGKGMIVDICSI